MSKISILNTKKVTTSSTTYHSAPLNASKRDTCGYYRYVAEPMAYDTIYTRDGERVQIESHVIGRDC